MCRVMGELAYVWGYGRVRSECSCRRLFAEGTMEKPLGEVKSERQIAMKQKDRCSDTVHGNSSSTA